MPSDAIRWGIAATGSIASKFVEDLQLVDEAEVAAVGSRAQERADAFAARFGIARAHGSLAALAADPGVDVVYVASPHAFHERDTTLFLQAGKHVLCEKPFALNAAQATRMATLAAEQGVFLMEAMWSRFLPAYEALRELLDDGRIGVPLMVEADFGFPLPLMPEHRLYDPALGGGALLDLGIYPAQLCSLAFGGPPDRIAAVGHLGSTGVDEQVAAVLHHPGGGLGIMKAAISTALACEGRLSGTDGWIRLPAPMHRPDHLVLGGTGEPERLARPWDGNGLRFQALEVHRCLRAGLRESTRMPLSETIALATTLDAIRAQIGLVYPGEQRAATPGAPPGQE
jgi:predicted dehydrogenase